MKNHKIIAFLLALLMILPNMSSTGYAAEPSGIAVALSAETVEAGQQVTVTVSLTGYNADAVPIRGIQIDVTEVDDSILVVEDGSFTSLIEDASAISNKAVYLQENQLLRLIYVRMTGTLAQPYEDVFQMTFLINSELTEEGTITLPLTAKIQTTESRVTIDDEITINYAPASEEPDPEKNGWVVENGVEYWYENGVKQGTEGRGKEIYDPASDAWYWLDAVQGGAKTVNKDVYQESEAGQWADRPDGTGKWVRYDANGHMVKGWSTNENGTYYFDPVYGTMAKGEASIDGKACYFDQATGVGADQEWVNLSGNEYWYEDAVRQGYDPNDAGYRGKEIYDPASDAWYWLDNVDGGKKAVSKDVYQESEAGQWADRPDGTGKWVRYDANGHMVKGWQTTDRGTYYFDPIYGTMAKGDAVIDGQSHYFDRNTGVMVR